MKPHHLKILMNQRQKINQLDKKIVKLIEKRSILTASIIKYKQKHNIPLYDKKREKEIITTLSKNSFLPKIYIQSLYEIIFQKTRNTKNKKKYKL